jgi:hypothetical protein
MKKKIIIWLIVVIVVVIAGCAGYVWTALSWSYSSGERAGFVQKFSHKGWVCKTWEGELSMIALPGALPEKFIFSVRDDAVARNINSSMGKKVKLKYDQHLGLPSTCFGETSYFVKGVQVLE